MSEPVDTSAQAVERWAGEFEHLSDETDKLHWCHYYEVAALLRALAAERAELQRAHSEEAAHYAARMGEMEALLATRNQQNAALVKDRDRFEWFFGESDKLPFMSNYMLGVRESWTPDQWRAAIDAASGAREGE